MTNNIHTLITLPLKNLHPFDMNPRLTRNPDYEEIKASIRLRGLDHPPHITQRPGELFYIIANGGNTRLAILNELWQETREERYRNIACLFHPWQTEKSVGEGNLHCLLGHLIENEMRGSLTFIERALGVCRARECTSSPLPRPCRKPDWRNCCVITVSRSHNPVSVKWNPLSNGCCPISPTCCTVVFPAWALKKSCCYAVTLNSSGISTPRIKQGCFF